MLHDFCHDETDHLAPECKTQLFVVGAVAVGLVFGEDLLGYGRPLSSGIPLAQPDVVRAHGLWQRPPVVVGSRWYGVELKRSRQQSAGNGLPEARGQRVGSAHGQRRQEQRSQ